MKSAIVGNNGKADAVDEFSDWEASLVSQAEFELGKGLVAAHFPATPLAATQQTADLSAYDTPVRSQGSRGWCTAFATIGAIENVAKRALGKALDISEIDLFQSYRQYYQLVSMKTAATIGAAPESAWPYNGNPVANYQAQRNVKVAAYAGPQNRDEVLAELAAGNPLTIGLTTYREFMRPASDGRINMPTGNPGGGHAIAVTGFVRDDSYAGGGYLLLKNSWGTKWGDGGYGRLPLDYCRTTKCWFLSVRSITVDGTTTPINGSPLNVPTDPTPLTPADAVINNASVQTVAVPEGGDARSFRLK